MNFKEELKRRTEEAEHVIREYLPEESGFAKTMAEAMNYSMTAGGKRLRPILIRETYELFEERISFVSLLWRLWR